ncbi:DUF4386 domain-containing protein [Jatrophihabitans cynanchi]|uniref:DUF4386 domain-containing protein n=1 Tax=Jatrophihabitans cynanchi TaxID=2944128 RepID=A0ABY7JYS6_9ACTN|nr:DUF4386 domain-containing protein [Jatrophihabitans sp. SB3-54]WAX57140.1 DUF4386 domain-containing protein [Jatrophihabitans sp. SB3-54]
MSISLPEVPQPVNEAEKAPASVARPGRRIALITGVLFLITFVTSIPALLLYQPVLNHVGFIVGDGGDTRVLWGAFLELLLIVANIGTAVVIFPILKRQHEGLALGYVTARVIECVFIGVGVLSLLAIVTLRQDLAGTGANRDTLTTVGRSLVAVKDWTFLLGPGFVVGIGNGLILGYLMYRSGLVPRRMAMLGLIGGPLIVASGTAVLFGGIAFGGAAQFVATIPEFAWELSLGIYLTVKGFTPSALTDRTPPSGNAATTVRPTAATTTR